MTRIEVIFFELLADLWKGVGATRLYEVGLAAGQVALLCSSHQLVRLGQVLHFRLDPTTILIIPVDVFHGISNLKSHIGV